MKRIYNHFLGLNNLRKFCGNATVFKYAKKNFKLEILDKPKSGRVLVLAAHPDDDVFGCGGSLAMHAKQGDKVKMIYFAGNVAKKFQNPNVKYQIMDGRSIDREKEARDAARILKVSDVEFWRLVDNKFTADSRNIARLKEVIKEYKPEIIYCPSFTDANSDHYEVSRILYSVIARSGAIEKTRSRNNARPVLDTGFGMTSECQIAASRRTSGLAMTEILLYEVWSPIYANRLVKIDNVIEEKKQAIECHQSQLSDRSYFDAIIGLNQYRAGMFNAGKYAEAFTEMNIQLFAKLFEKYQLK